MKRTLKGWWVGFQDPSWWLFAVIAVVIMVWLFAVVFPRQIRKNNLPDVVTVIRIEDSNTMIVTSSGYRRKVRLSLSRAPQSSGPYIVHPECGGDQAKRWLEQRLLHKSVALQVGGDTSSYNALLKGRSVSIAMIRAGWAEPLLLGEQKIDRVLVAAAKAAKTDKRGIWKLCGGFAAESAARVR